MARTKQSSRMVPSGPPNRLRCLEELPYSRSWQSTKSQSDLSSATSKRSSSPAETSSGASKRSRMSGEDTGDEVRCFAVPRAVPQERQVTDKVPPCRRSFPGFLWSFQESKKWWPRSSTLSRYNTPLLYTYFGHSSVRLHMLLLQRYIDLVLGTKAELDKAQAEAAGFRQGPIEFAVQLRRLGSEGSTRLSSLQQEVDKLEELRVICHGHLSGYSSNQLSIDICLSSTLGPLRSELDKEQRLRACYPEFADREQIFSKLICGIAEVQGYPIAHNDWL